MARKPHPAFLVEDLAALLVIMAAAGCIVRTDEFLDGYERAYVDDPFGTKIELMQPKA